MRSSRRLTPLVVLAAVVGVSACSDSRGDEELAPAPTSGTTTTTTVTRSTVTVPVTARLATTTTVGPTFTLPLETADPPATAATSAPATTAPPSTARPTTAAPTTAAQPPPTAPPPPPASAAPPTAAPTTAAPTTAAPPTATAPPTTAAPTTAVATTAAPTTATAPPTTAVPTTATAPPTTAVPTTVAPTVPPVLYEPASPTPFDDGASAPLDADWIVGGVITGPISDGRYWGVAQAAGADTVTFRLSQVFIGQACGAQFPDPAACEDGFEVLDDPSGTLAMVVGDVGGVAVLDAADPPTTYTIEPAELVRLLEGDPPTGAPPGFTYGDAPFFVTVAGGRIVGAQQVDTSSG